MSNDPVFETLTPSQFLIFTVPNTLHHRCHLHTPRIRFAVLDSPIPVAVDCIPKIAAMIVPEHRETDWKFCSESGQLQLLFNFPDVSRLILIGNDLAHNPQLCVYIRPPPTDTVDRLKLEDELQSVVSTLHPKVCFQNGSPKPVFLTYQDGVMCRVNTAIMFGPFVGEFVVEDVQMESNDDDSAVKKLRRRLRFKRTPNLIQSQVPLIPILENGERNTHLDLESLRKMKNVKFEVDTTVFIHPYLTPMVSGLLLIASLLSDRVKKGFAPRALCLGVGGGALLTFLNTQLGFQVVGIEADDAVLMAAKKYFGLNDENENLIKLIVEDAIDVIENFGTINDTKVSELQANFDSLYDRFDVVMVDLDSSEARNGICAPPQEFVKQSVFQGVKLLLRDHGALIINVVPPDEAFYMTLIQELKDAFHKVYEIDVDDEDNFVLVATVSPSNSSSDVEDGYDFLEKLRSVIPEDYVESFDEL